MTPTQISDRAHQLFSDAFFSALTSAITEASGTPWHISVTPDADTVPDGSEPVRITLALDGSLQGQFLLEFRPAEVDLLASMLSRQTIDESGAGQAQVLLNLIESALSEFCLVLEQEFGTFTISASSAFQPVPEGASVVHITAVNDDDGGLSVAMYIHPELALALMSHSQVRTLAAESVDPAKIAAVLATQEPVNLDLVMDVELNVTLRFGKRQLTLREVMELTSGSVVELDRELEEPVELLLNGMVIARGEAVVIDGNYGLRVTEVSQQVSTMDLN
jgi:flagellar motor switch protein FliN/FliY